MVNDRKSKKISKNSEFKIQDVTMTRRAFITGFLLGLTTEVAGDIAKDLKLSIVDSLTKRWNHRKIVPEIEKILFEEMFNDFSIEAGYSHPKVDGVHPDNLEVLFQLTDLFNPEECEIETYRDNAGEVNDKGNIICIGGPISARSARKALRFAVNESNQKIVVQKLKNNLINLPLEYTCGVVEKHKIHYWLMGEKHFVPNWSIKSDIPNIYVDPPVSSRDGSLMTDYMLITRIPNILEIEGYLAGKKMLIIGGCHGLGTRSFQNIIDSSDIQELMYRNLRDYQYYQLLIKMDVRHDEKQKKSFAQNFQFVRAIPLDKYIDRQRILQGLDSKKTKT